MNERLNVIHIVDSLATGGAERVAVNMANVLAEKGVNVHLCVTRSEGGLKALIDPRVKYLFLNRKGVVGLKGICNLRRYIRKNKIKIAHAHSSSAFTAVLSTIGTRCKVVWHDHLGNPEYLAKRELLLLLLCRRFSYVYAVNYDLTKWNTDVLHVSSDKVEYLPNFPVLSDGQEHVRLPGNKPFKMICTANLREQKDHFTLIKAVAEHTDKVDLYLVGNDWNDNYSKEVKKTIAEYGIAGSVHILGSRNDILSILKECDIGILSSKSEGLPVSLLEYGLAGLPVICTSVGECATVLGNGEYGMLVESGDVDGLSSAIERMLSDEKLRAGYASKFHKHVMENYSKDAIMEHVINKYYDLIHE